MTVFRLSLIHISMFWGDIIVGFPEMIKELPKEIICLNWGYMWNQREEETKWMHEAGAVQYCCPGCCGWNEFSALNWYAYTTVSYTHLDVYKRQVKHCVAAQWIIC